MDSLNEIDLSLDFLLQETLMLSEKIQKEAIQLDMTKDISSFEDLIEEIEIQENSNITRIEKPLTTTEVSRKLYPDENDQDLLFDLVDEVYNKGLSVLEEKKEILDKLINVNVNKNSYEENSSDLEILNNISNNQQSIEDNFPHSPGIIYRVDKGTNTFCIRGLATENLHFQIKALKFEDSKLQLLKASSIEDNLYFFETVSYEIAETIKDQIINRRFPIIEDSVCNISDPGYSWWMDISNGRFEIHFKAHLINRVERSIKLGPIGDARIAMLRLNQAHALLRSSFPLSEFSCSEKSLVVASEKPDHSSFLAFQDIFLKGINHTSLENFPDNSVGKTLYFYFLELSMIRKFWIEVESKLS